MTPGDHKELICAQREVIWNLQRDSVVTVVRPGDDPVPYKRQGNSAVNTPQCVRMRQSLKKNPLIQVTCVGVISECCKVHVAQHWRGGGGGKAVVRMCHSDRINTT